MVLTVAMHVCLRYSGLWSRCSLEAYTFSDGPIHWFLRVTAYML